MWKLWSRCVVAVFSLSPLPCPRFVCVFGFLVRCLPRAVSSGLCESRSTFRAAVLGVRQAHQRRILRLVPRESPAVPERRVSPPQASVALSTTININTTVVPLLVYHGCSCKSRWQYQYYYSTNYDYYYYYYYYCYYYHYFYSINTTTNYC